uniref:Uncharacterized protein n=1 Tax=Strombidium rassoulzadegani TaxID=1082188 RepID=A0A7S3FWS7_9SPIT|mmetsp:Transcript_4721/g.8063  ORF Transcript_4721/g.8063 Transcript_4721/m.8063 type:complete len:194 (+) Transcript_4721:879-1460(+)
MKMKKKQASEDEEEDEEGGLDSKGNPTGSKGVYKASKLNPIMYEDKGTKKAAQRLIREDKFSRNKLSRSSYMQMLRDEVDDKPEEVVGGAGLQRKSAYMKEMENLEKVENMYFTRMNMSKAQKKYKREQEDISKNMELLDHFDDLRDIDKVLSGARHSQPFSSEGPSSKSKFASSKKQFLKKRDQKRSSKGSK